MPLNKENQLPARIFAHNVSTYLLFLTAFFFPRSSHAARNLEFITAINIRNCIVNFK